MKAVKTAKNKIPWGKSRIRTIMYAQTYDNILIRRRILQTLVRLSKGRIKQVPADSSTRVTIIM